MAPKLFLKLDELTSIISDLDYLSTGLVRGRIFTFDFFHQIFPSSDNVSLDLLTQPVHILDDSGNLSPSAFIPFCSFEGNSDLLGREYGNFSLPVCSSFRRRIFDGQICYQIDVDGMINNKTAAGLQKEGLSLLVDTNAEYDLSRLDGKSPDEEIFDDFTEEFFEAEDHKIMIYIETISNPFPRPLIHLIQIRSRISL